MVGFLDTTERRRLAGSLRLLAAELSAVEERERRELATFLHDKIGQSLAVLRMRFGDISKRLGSSELGDRVESMRDLLEEAIEETQSLTFQLSPPVLYELGLEPALEWVGEKICGEGSLGFAFVDDGRAKRLDNDLAALVFRAVRELLYNVVKHAQASKVDLRVERRDNRLRVTLTDDGVGFDPEESSVQGRGHHFGLFSLRERLKAVGGKLSMESSADRGTRATIEIDISDPDAGIGTAGGV